MNERSAETRSVVIEREFPFPLEKIWRALTQPHLIAEWLMENDFKPAVGYSFQLRGNPKPEVNILIDCEVLAVEPHKTLTYTWAAMGLDSVVTWTLTKTGNGTHLRMEQSGFRADQSQAFHGARAGWQRFLGNLEKILARL